MKKNEREIVNLQGSMLIGRFRFFFPGPTFLPVQYVTHEGEKIVFREAKKDEDIKYCIVMGKRSSPEYTKKGVTCMRVILFDKSEHEKIKKILRENGLEGQINFW